MIKMMVKMNEDRIKSINEYSLERVYSGLDNVFAKFGIRGEIVNGYHEYKGNNDPSDFGKFGRIYNGLRKQSWFADNVKEWYLYNSDDVENADDFSVEDLLSYDGSRVGVSA